MSTVTPPPNEVARLQKLWQESRKIRGVSLGKDAWRRLKRDRISFTAMIFLMLLGVFAALTPLLPLQPPRSVDTPRAFHPPVVAPLFTGPCPMHFP